MKKKAFSLLIGICLLLCSACDNMSESPADRIPDSNAALVDLKTSSGVLYPPFDPVITSYQMSVENSASPLSLTAVPASVYARITYSSGNPATLDVGINSLKISVTSEDGSKQKEYEISVRRFEPGYTSPNIGNMMYIPSGTFQRDGTPENTSYVSALRMSENEISYTQYVAITGITIPDSYRKISLDNASISYDNWYDAVSFCNKLSMKETLEQVYTITNITYSADKSSITSATVTADFNKNGYRLPTEMEWMWAAMGADMENPGKKNTTGYLKPFSGSNGSNSIDDYVWYQVKQHGKTILQTQPVGTKLPNELGIHDLSGNGWDWCWDYFGGDKTTFPVTGKLTDYRGPLTGTYHVNRGGDVWQNTQYCSLASRTFYPPDMVEFLSFHVVRR